MNAEVRLEITTPTPREIVMTRRFDAPREAVFDALTRPDLLRRWYGPTGWTLPTCDIDLRPGGAFRFVSRKPDGREIGQRGVYREVVRPSRIVNTEVWEDWNPGEVLVTTEFAAVGSGTLLTVTTLYPTQEVRDMLIKAGMMDHAGEAYDKLASVVETSS